MLLPRGALAAADRTHPGSADCRRSDSPQVHQRQTLRHVVTTRNRTACLVSQRRVALVGEPSETRVSSRSRGRASYRIARAGRIYIVRNLGDRGQFARGPEFERARQEPGPASAGRIEYRSNEIHRHGLRRLPWFGNAGGQRVGVRARPGRAAQVRRCGTQRADRPGRRSFDRMRWRTVPLQVARCRRRCRACRQDCRQGNQGRVDLQQLPIDGVLAMSAFDNASLAASGPAHVPDGVEARSRLRWSDNRSAAPSAKARCRPGKGVPGTTS